MSTKDFLEGVHLQWFAPEGGEGGGTAGAGGAGGSGGEGGGAAGAGGSGGAGGGGTEEEPVYISQLSPDNRKNEAIKNLLKGKRTLNDLVLAYADSESKRARSILIPNMEKPDAEEVKAFKKAMGLPENKDDLKIDTSAFKDVHGLEEIVARVKDDSIALGLTKTQAQKYFNNIMTMAKVGREAASKSRTEMEKTFEARLLEAVGKDEKKKQETLNLFKAGLIKRFGSKLISSLADTGILYDTDFALRVAQMAEDLGEADFIEGRRGDHKGQKRGSQGSYSPQFQAAYGQAKKE